MTVRAVGLRKGLRTPLTSLLAFLILQSWSGLGSAPLHGQSRVPGDQIHVSVTLGGYILLGVGYTRWIEQHHALEFTLFPVAYPSEGFPFGLRAGHAWIPSNERWRAKLGSNVTVLVRPVESSRRRFTPILAFTPGVHYEPSDSQTFRADVWMSWFLTEKVFAPTGVEILSGWNR